MLPNLRCALSAVRCNVEVERSEGSPGFIAKQCEPIDLTAAAHFPRPGVPFDVMDRVRATAADGDMLQAVDGAANEWFGGHRWRLRNLIYREEQEDEESRQREA
jgi:hypothetical protein